MLSLNLPWLALPLLTAARMARTHPFSEFVPATATATAAVLPSGPGEA